MKKLRLLTLLLGILLSLPMVAQPQQPVSWKASAVQVEGNVYEVRLVGTIDGSEWHIYDLGPYKDGPNATSLTIDLKGNAKLVGKPFITSKVNTHFDEMFGMEIGTCGDKVTVCQRVEVLKTSESTVTATIEWQACNEGTCIPPTDEEFEVKLPARVAGAADNANNASSATGDAAADKAAQAAEGAVAVDGNTDSDGNSSVDNTDNGSNATISQDESNASTGDAGGKKSLWAIILKAMGWGLVMLLTPCVFPMIPMTVSFFLKKNSGEEAEKAGKSRGKFLAAFFGIFIIALYTIPIAVIILITYFAGGPAVTADIFNWLATHWLPNILFFLIFMVFAASFFGAFEITMPSKLVNKSDSKSEKGGLGGVFFLALTLVLVSFSCTGPIVGSVLIESTQGGVWEPIITMFAFSVAFALPFMVFAFAPSLLKNLPKSGGWLNSVKVVLGFVEVALGFKFLSVADQTYHWHLLDREVYLAIWIVVFTLLGLYLLGKIKFVYDSPVDHLSVLRLILSITVFTFVVYMIPGMWGAPLKALSGYLPPMNTQDFNLAQSSGGGATYVVGENSAGGEGGFGFAPKYSDFIKKPIGLDAFFDYNEGMEYAKKVGKPVFLDFTGGGCVNCREMESRVFSDSRVHNTLRDKYIMVQLYGDDKTVVDEKDWITTDQGKVLKSLGKINSYLVMKKYNVNAQPFYVLIDPTTDSTMNTRGYNLDVEAFIAFLNSGLK